MEIKLEWFSPATPFSTLLKARPLPLALCENFRINPWKAMQCGAGEACAARGICWESFVKALDGPPVPDRDSEWKSLSIYHLLDFLTAEHRDFLGDFVPSIGRVLSDNLARDPDSLARFRILVSEWPGFVSTLAGHIREEEDELFRRILRYDAILRPDLGDPDFEGGSVRVYTTIRMSNQEHRDLILMEAFLGRALEKRIYDRFIMGGQRTSPPPSRWLRPAWERSGAFARARHPPGAIH